MFLFQNKKSCPKILQDPMVDVCEKGNESSDSEGDEFHDQLSRYELLRAALRQGVC